MRYRKHHRGSARGADAWLSVWPVWGSSARSLGGVQTVRRTARTGWGPGEPQGPGVSREGVLRRGG